MKIFLSATLLLFYFGSMAQTEVWRHSDTLGGIFSARNINIDANGNLYVAGPAADSLYPNAYTSAALVFKLDSAGNYQWNNGFIYYWDMYYYGMAGDSAGNSYLYGQYVDSSSGNIYGFLTRVDSAGNYVWTKHYTDRGIYDVFNNAVVDKSGKVLVSAQSGDIQGGQELVTLKFSAADSSPVWNIVFPDPNGFYNAYLAQTDNAGGAYNLGQASITDFGYTLILVKYNSNGSFQWQQDINSTPYSDEVPASTNVDAAGNLYILDQSSPSATNFNYVPYVIKISPSGNIAWKTLLPDTNVDYILESSALDANAFYIAGSRHDSIYIAKFSATTGDTLWTFQYQWGNANKIVLKNNALYATGFINPSGTNDFFTMKLTLNGLMLWNTTYNDTMNGDDHAYDLVADNSGNIYVAGQSYETVSGGGSATVIKYHDEGFNCSLVVSSIATTMANNDSANGSAIAIITGGTLPYIFNWSNGAVTDTIERVAADLYCVTVTDRHGCVANLCDSVRPVPCTLSIGAVTYTDAHCFGHNNGSIIITSTGGFGQVLYSIDSGAHYQADSIFSNLPGGVNNVTIRDANACFVPYNYNPVIINAAAADTPTIVVTGDTLSPGQYYKYNWYLGDSVIGTNQMLVVGPGIDCGNIYVQVTDFGQCVYNSSYYENICTGVNTLSAADMNLTIYPNPFGDHVNGILSGDLPGNGMQLALFDIYGRQLYGEMLTGNNFSIPASILPQGMYLIRIQSGGEFLYKQGIKAGRE